MSWDFTSRIAKLDAISLDSEFLSFVKREITGLLIAVTGEESLQKFTPEISLLVKFILWKFSTSSSGSTVGQRLLGIKYAPGSAKLRLLFVLEGVIPYLIERVQSLRETRVPTVARVRWPLKCAQNVFKVLHLMNFCIFLIQNRYPTLATRFLKLPIVPVDRRYNPAAGYSYQIRELLWHQFADLLIFILPMVNLQKMKRSVLQFFGASQSQAIISTNNHDSGAVSRTVIKCSVCSDDAVIPQRVENEFYCYYCYQLVAETGF